MNLEDVVIERVCISDMEGVLELARRNGPDYGGELSVRITAEDVSLSGDALPNIVARRNGRVIGFLLTREQIGFLPPILRAMFSACPGSHTAYSYGPVCVDAPERGRGIAGAMFVELLRLLPGREGVLFIKADNEASLRAHRKMGMRELAKFAFEGKQLIVFAYNI